MNARSRIAVATNDVATRELLKDSLELLGHETELLESGLDLVQLCQTRDVDLAIVELCMSPLDGLQVAEQIYERRPVPVIVILGNEHPETLNRVQSAHIFGFLIKPIRIPVIGPAIELAERRFAELQVLQEEAACLRRALCDRKIIERAKGIVMRQSEIDEADAFRRLQKLARNKSKKLAEIAEMIITAHEVCEPTALQAH